MSRKQCHDITLLPSVHLVEICDSGELEEPNLPWMAQRAGLIQVSFPNPASQLGILCYAVSPEEKWVRLLGFTTPLKACCDSWEAGSTGSGQGNTCSVFCTSLLRGKEAQGVEVAWGDGMFL